MNEVKIKKLKKKDKDEISSAVGLFTQLGFSMFFCIFVGLIAGKALDGLFGTSPVLMLLCTLAGAASSYKVLYDLVIKKWMK